MAIDRLVALSAAGTVTWEKVSLDRRRSFSVVPICIWSWLLNRYASSVGWRRRVLRFPDAQGLRPTPGPRETLFNWLGQDLDGHRASIFCRQWCARFRGLARCGRVVMVEHAPKVAAALEEMQRPLAAGGVCRLSARMR